MQNYGNPEFGGRNQNDEALLHEMIYRRYLVNRDKVRDALDKITVPEYLLLHELETGSGRLYLQEIADQMELSTPAASKMARELKDRGLVIWSHDGAGEEGTYVELTEEGAELITYQEKILKRYFGRVIERFGTENMIRLLQLMKDLEKILKSEYEVLEAEKQAETGRLPE